MIKIMIEGEQGSGKSILAEKIRRLCCPAGKVVSLQDDGYRYKSTLADIQIFVRQIDVRKIK